MSQSAPNRKLLMSLLSLLNCDVVGAENGRIAVDLFAGQWERSVARICGCKPLVRALEGMCTS